MKFTSLASLAFTSTVLAQENWYTATGTAAVAAAAATAKTSSPTSNVQGKAFDRFYVIWLENTDYDLAASDPNLAWLASKGLALTNQTAVTHPSEPNYVAAHGGDYFGINNDNFIQLPANVSSVIDLLDTRGISWGEYQEDLPYSGFEGVAYINHKTGANDYVRKHNPAVIFNSVAHSEQRLSQIKNLTLFYSDLKANKLPQYAFITPNMTSDGHDTSVTTAGKWTRNFLEPLLNDANFMQNTLVLVTFDENESYALQNRIFGVLLGDALPQSLVGQTDNSYYNHYSQIATIEANWGLPTLGRFDVGANVYQFVGQKTGDAIRKWSKIAFNKVFFNQSYAGPYNSAPSGGLPPPNVAASYNGRKVLPSIVSQWSSANQTYYSTALEIPDGQHPPVYTQVNKSRSA